MTDHDRGDPTTTGPDDGGMRVAWPSLAYWAQVTIVVALVILVVLQLRRAADVLALILMALVLAVGLEPSVRLLERRGMRRGLAVAAIFVSAVAAFGVFLWFAIPEFVDQAKTFARSLPGLIDELAAREDWIGSLVRDADVKTHLQDVVANLPGRIASSVGSIVGVTSKITSLFFRLFTVAILTVYLLLSYPTMRRAIAARAPVTDRGRLDGVVNTIAARIGGYISGKFILGGLSAVVTALVLILLGIDFWFPLAAWAGFASLIPIVGVYLGATPAVLIALTDSPGKAVIVVIFFVVYQQVHDYVISPRVMKDSVDLSPAAVMVATIVGGRVGGFLGIVLALPVAAAIKAVVMEYYWGVRASDQPVDPADPVEIPADPGPSP